MAQRGSPKSGRHGFNWTRGGAIKAFGLRWSRCLNPSLQEDIWPPLSSPQHQALSRDEAVRPPLAPRTTSAHMQEDIDLIRAWKHLRAQASSSCWLEPNGDKTLDVDSEFSARAIVAAEEADTTPGSNMVSAPSRYPVQDKATNRHQHLPSAALVSSRAPQRTGTKSPAPVDYLLARI